MLTSTLIYTAAKQTGLNPFYIGEWRGLLRGAREENPSLENPYVRGELWSRAGGVHRFCIQRQASLRTGARELVSEHCGPASYPMNQRPVCLLLPWLCCPACCLPVH
jgi:hypothetical protein